MMRRVIGIGEVLWDRFPDGDRLGGAPANFAFHAGQLGATTRIVSRIGSDDDGNRLADELQKHGLPTEFLQRDATYPTGLVRVELAHGQPNYVIEKPAAWDFLELTQDLKNLAADVDAISFGTLAQRDPVSQRTIQDFVRLCPKKSLRLFDINLRQSYFTRETIEFGFTHATTLKLNGDELERLSLPFKLPSQPEAAAQELFRRYPLELIALTLGEEGCVLYTRECSIQSKAPRIKCVDTVGAGDAFSAALVTGLLAGEPLEEIAYQANHVGAYVASQPGAMPLLP